MTSKQDFRQQVARDLILQGTDIEYSTVMEELDYVHSGKFAVEVQAEEALAIHDMILEATVTITWKEES